MPDSGTLRRVVLRGVGALTTALPSPRRAPSPRPRLLAIRPDHLGDVLMTTATLAVLRRAEPAAEIVALVGPWSAPALRGNPDVDRIFTYAFPWFDRAAAGLADRYAAAAGLAAWLRALDIDRAYVLRPDHWWGAMAAALARIPMRVGYAVPENAPFLTRALAPPGREHVVRTAIRLVAGDAVAAAAVPGDPPTCLPFTTADRAGADAHLGSVGLAPDAPYVLFHPGASSVVKRWPAERWAAVADHLAADGLPVLLVGGPGESSVVDAVAAHARSPIRALRAAPGLGELAALLAGARLALGMDSAPMHVATAVGTPTLRLYGPGDEVLFGPWGDPTRHRAVRAPGTVPDPGWFGRDDGPHPTLIALSVDEVVAHLSSLRDAIDLPPRGARRGGRARRDSASTPSSGGSPA